MPPTKFAKIIIPNKTAKPIFIDVFSLKFKIAINPNIKNRIYVGTNINI